MHFHLDYLTIYDCLLLKMATLCAQMYIKPEPIFLIRILLLSMVGNGSGKVWTLFILLISCRDAIWFLAAGKAVSQGGRE